MSRSRRLVRRARDERARNQDQAHEADTPRHVAEERLRIAGALDSVTHSLASIAVQAGVGSDLLDADPDGAGAALLAIKQTSGEALDDLRTTLGILRSDADADADFLPLRPPRHRLRPNTSTEEPP